MVDARARLIEAAAFPDPLRRQMAIAAIICGRFRESGAIAVMVGGAAVEFYTAAQYLTGDVDFVTAATDRIKPAMEGLGFVNRGGTWVLPEAPSVLVEFPKGPLAGSYDRVLRVRLTDVDTADVIGLEDIIVDRMAAATHWKDGSEELAIQMAISHYEEIDWKYCLEAARRAECLDETRRLRNRALYQRRRLKQLRLPG